MITFVLATHAAFTKKGIDVHGPAHSVDQFLTFSNIAHLFIKFPIYGGFESICIDENFNTKLLGGKYVPKLLRPLWEIGISLGVCFRHRTRNLLYIGVDPLNAFTGVVAKALGLVRVVICYTPDYTEKRYANVLMNYIYHRIDLYASMHADQVWCVSNTIIENKIQCGIDPKNIYYVPNTPSMRAIGSIISTKGRTKRLVMVGNIVQTLDYSFVIDSMNELKKYFPAITLHIVGTGDYMNALKQIVRKKGLQQTVIFEGQLTHQKVIALLKTSSIGIALYTGKCSTNYSGDSMKIREYLSCGLPVLTTDVTETARLVHQYRAGEIISINRASFTHAIIKLLDVKRYGTYRKNALRAANDYNFDTMITKPLVKILSLTS